MTLVKEPAELEQDAPAGEKVAVDVEADAPARPFGRGWKRVVAIGLLAVVAVILTVAVFTGPIERIWYRNRQHQLAADMNQPRDGVAPGQAIAILQVPRIGINAVVVEGDGPERLRGGPGHHVGTASPGARGNSVITGHRSTWGAPFGVLERVRRGDLVAVQTRQAKTFVYKVQSIARVAARDTRVARTSKDHRITLMTGRGGRFSNDRLVVTAVSGTPARASLAVRALRAPAPGSSVIFNSTLLLALIAFALAAAAGIYLRRRSGPIATSVVVLPLVAAGALCLLLDLSLLLPPLI